VSPRNPCQFPLTVCASATDGVLIVRWTYDPVRFRPETIAQLAGRLAAELHTMLGLGRESAGAAHTPADFPLANVDQAQLDELLSKF
jgi:non-ribosomal peptide synthase protein (TIGR01720 family)